METDPQVEAPSIAHHSARGPLAVIAPDAAGVSRNEIQIIQQVVVTRYPKDQQKHHAIAVRPRLQGFLLDLEQADYPSQHLIISPNQGTESFSRA